MRLTTFTDYCLRVLLYVGVKGGGVKGEALSTIDEIASSYGISRNHLMKVVSRLGQLGYLETVRGKNGGVCLACDPADINIGLVVRRTEEDLALVACFQSAGAICRIESACVLKTALGDAMEAFFAVLDGYTLADLLEPRSRLIGLLRVPTPA